METLVRETDKLISYRVQGEITRADVELVTHKSLEASIFDLSKALLGSGGRTRAFQILNDLFTQREEPTRVLSVLSGAFIDLYRAKAAHNAGKTPMICCLSINMANGSSWSITLFGTCPGTRCGCFAAV